MRVLNLYTRLIPIPVHTDNTIWSTLTKGRGGGAVQVKENQGKETREAEEEKNEIYQQRRKCEPDGGQVVMQWDGSCRQPSSSDNMTDRAEVAKRGREKERV